MKRAWRNATAWMGRSIASRMVGPGLAMLLVIQVANFTAIWMGLGAQARGLPPDGLAAGGRVLQGLLAITLLGIAGWVIASLVAARRVATPLRTLASAADAVGAGHYPTPIEGLRRSDEIGQLARAFEQMRIGVADRQARALELAYWDGLTGLPNRLQFRDAVHEAITQAQRRADRDEAGASVAVIVLDLDRFKHVNDVLGHAIGDRLLRAIGERLTQQAVRGGDLVARLGGDRFAVLLRSGDDALAGSVAQRIGDALAAPLRLDDHTVEVEISAAAGMACWPAHAVDADMLLSRAEIATQAAKRRAQAALLYDASIDAASVEALALLTELHHAVAHGELRLYLQPKLQLDSGRIGGAEALLRWQHPQRGLVAPKEFIPLAEQTGFIRTLTIWVFEEAARHWLALRSSGVALTLAVNLSTRDLLDPTLPDQLDALLVEHSVPAEAFCLEITEGAIMADPKRALATLNRLSALGFRLSIDDFGTGYSSLAGLKRLPVDELKIDKTFVIGMERDLDDLKIVRSAIELAHNLQLTVVAEGVENARAWDVLRELDCDEAQGFHMGRPMPAAEFHRWAAAWTAQQRTRRTAGAAAAFMLH